MKKVEDYNIKIRVNVATCKQSFTLVCSIHTRIQEIILKVCKHLDFDRFDTKMQIYANHYIPMKPTSTLLQNNVQNNDTITANILSTKNKPTTTNKSLPLTTTTTTKRPASLQKRTSRCYGLTLICACVEPRCINYGVEELVPIGFGEFKFYDLISSRKCNVCPYRDQKKNPSMVMKEVKMENCAWKINGTHNSSTFPTQADTGWRRVGEQGRGVYKMLAEFKWSNDISLTVKDL